MLDERQVAVAIGRAAHRVARGIAKLELRRGDEGCRIEEARGRAQRGIKSGTLSRNEHGPLRGDARKAVGVGGLRDGNGHAALQRDDALHLPSA